MAAVGSLEEEALKRRARLKALQNKRTVGVSEVSTEVPFGGTRCAARSSSRIRRNRSTKRANQSCRSRYKQIRMC